MEANLIIGYCPNCHSKIEFDPNSTSRITCRMCDMYCLPNDILRALPSKQPTTQGPKFCSECGAKLAPGTRFCTNCGHKIF